MTTKTINDITLYELAGIDHEVSIKKNKEFGFDVTIINEEDGLFIEPGLHPYAAESLAMFCKQYLDAYTKIAE